MQSVCPLEEIKGEGIGEEVEQRYTTVVFEPNRAVIDQFDFDNFYDGLVVEPNPFKIETNFQKGFHREYVGIFRFCSAVVLRAAWIPSMKGTSSSCSSNRTLQLS